MKQTAFDLNNSYFINTTFRKMRIHGKEFDILSFPRNGNNVKVDDVKSVFNGKNTISIYNNNGRCISENFNIKKSKNDEGPWELGCQTITKQNVNKLRSLLFETKPKVAAKPKIVNRVFNLNTRDLRNSKVIIAETFGARKKNVPVLYFPRRREAVSLDEVRKVLTNRNKTSMHTYTYNTNEKQLNFHFSEFHGISRKNGLKIGCQKINSRVLQSFRKAIGL